MGRRGTAEFAAATYKPLSGRAGIGAGGQTRRCGGAMASSRSGRQGVFVFVATPVVSVPRSRDVRARPGVARRRSFVQGSYWTSGTSQSRRQGAIVESTFPKL